MAGAFAKAGGRCAQDGAEGIRRIRLCQSVENSLQGLVQHCGLHQRSGEQHDAEIGIAADRIPGGVDRTPDALANRKTWCRDHGRSSMRAFDKIADHHAVAVREDMHVARLDRLQFPPDRPLRKPRRWRPSPALQEMAARLLRPASILDRKSSASACAISTSTTPCNPLQAGMLFTSSTNSLPWRSRITSTPQ